MNNTPHHKSHHVHSLFKELTRMESINKMSIDLNACQDVVMQYRLSSRKQIPITGTVQKGFECHGYALIVILLKMMPMKRPLTLCRCLPAL